MKPMKNSVAVVIKNNRGEFLVVERPKDEDGPLAGVWGFPAVTLKEGETEEDAVRRVGQVKLGVELSVISKIGEKTGDRGDHTLHLSDYLAEIADDAKPVVPQSDMSMTQYADLKYVSDPTVLFPAAQKGSLCSQVYLQSIGVDWLESSGSLHTSRIFHANSPVANMITIRPATASDAAAIADIHMASRAATMPYLPPQKRNHEQVTLWVKDVLLKTCHMWVAERDGMILGYAALEGDMLEHLYIHPNARRQGIGTLLLNEVKRDSPGGVSLHVFQQNVDARKFYERHGFATVSTTDGGGNMENLPDMTMRWTPS